MKSEFIYGANTAEEIFFSGKRKIYRIIIAKGKGGKAEKIARMARRKKIPVVIQNPRYLDKLAKGGNHQGIIIEAQPLETFGLHDALKSAEGRKVLWAAVDSITDPMNLGSIIRSCACFGVEHIIIPERRAAGLTPAVQKAASGAIEKVKTVRVVNLNQTILELKEKGFWIYGADMSGADVSKTDFAFPALLVIGSEGDGLHAKTREHCDALISVPQKGGVESLNASVAAGILLYEMSRKS